MSISLKSYITGFILSFALTVTAYILVANHLLSGWMIVAVILTLALVQLVVQLFFFLHLGQEAKPRWNLIFFLSTVSIILIIVIGSLWIMKNLNYNMTPADMNTYIFKNEGMHK